MPDPGGGWRRGAIGLAAWAASGCVSARAQPLEEATFVIPTVSFTFTAAYVAEDQKLWEKAGLKIATRQILGIGALNAVISGSAEFTHITSGSFTRAAARGQRLLAIANTVDRPMIELVVRREIAEKAGFDPKAPLAERGRVLKGLTLSAGGVNSILHGYLRIVASGAGLDSERDLRMAPMEVSNVFPSFKSRIIDGFVASQPWTLAAVDSGDAVLVASSPKGDLKELVPFGYNLVVTRPDVCQKRRSLCEKMGRAIVAAVSFIHERPAEVVAILKRRFPQTSDELVRHAFDEIKAATPRPPTVTVADLENSELYNVRAGLMKPEEKLKSYEGLFTTEFVR